MSQPYHLLTVWNPSYSTDAMDDHLSLLLDQAKTHHQENERRLAKGDPEIRVSEESAYVWWAKINSKNRKEPLPHLTDILNIQKQIEKKVETHLYLTDLRSLYVAGVSRITSKDILDDEAEEDHVPAYYREGNYSFDCWFKLYDIRRLVGDDNLAVVEELQKLKNTRYHDNPVSLFGGLVGVPLIVSRDRERLWFVHRKSYTGGRLWAEYDAEFLSQTAKMAKTVREDLLGRKCWAAMEISSRNFIATAEAVFRTRRDDPRFDFSPVIVEYCKAVEVELNTLFFDNFRNTLSHTLSHLPPKDTVTEIHQRRDVNLIDCDEHFTVGTIITFLRSDARFKSCLKKALVHDQGWLLGKLSDELAPLRNARNAAAHEKQLSREEAEEIRNHLLGIGCKGLMPEIISIKMKYEDS